MKEIIIKSITLFTFFGLIALFTFYRSGMFGKFMLSSHNGGAINVSLPDSNIDLVNTIQSDSNAGTIGTTRFDSDAKINTFPEPSLMSSSKSMIILSDYNALFKNKSKHTKKYNTKPDFKKVKEIYMFSSSKSAIIYKPEPVSYMERLFTPDSPSKIPAKDKQKSKENHLPENDESKKTPPMKMLFQWMGAVPVYRVLKKALKTMQWN